MDKIKKFIKQNGIDVLLAFIIPVILMVIAYYNIDIFLGSKRSVLASDAFSQYSNFHASYRNMMLGKESPFYTFNAGLGLNYYAFISYYLGGIFTPLVAFFNNTNMPDTLYLLTLLKIGSAGLTFWIFAHNTFKINRFLNIGLSVAYSLMSFSIAQSEIVMWLDAFVWFPLVILGIDRLMQLHKPKVLFFSYFFLFTSNYYFGFMIGLFSVMYFFVRYIVDFKAMKKTIIPYFTTSILSGLSSMIMILPMFLDLRNNGETLTQISGWRTDQTSWLDAIMKNMVGSYDTTQYNSIPFIYIGLLPLLCCIFYFVTKKVNWKEKVGFGLIGIFIIASFYLLPLDLMWQGFHSPNMFLFRYSFLLSFLVVMLAGYGLEKMDRTSVQPMLLIGIVVMVIFSVAYFARKSHTYTFVDTPNYVLTMVFLGAYVLLFVYLQINKKSSMSRIALMFLLLMSVEAGTNSIFLLKGIKSDWGYADAASYTDARKPLQTLIADAKKDNHGVFYRMENFEPISTNETLNLQYPGMSFFSSVRNRNVSQVIDALGFSAPGTALNTRYDNNTLLMDGLMGMRYNIAYDHLGKFGFKSIDKAGDYELYQNQYALPLGLKTSDQIFNVNWPDNDNLGKQTALMNTLADKNYQYFNFVYPELVSYDQTKVKEDDSGVTIKTDSKNNIQRLHYKVTIPEGKQAYFSLFNLSCLQYPSAAIEGHDIYTHWTEIGGSGQYYNLGYFKEEKEIEFDVAISGTTKLTMITPPVVLLDIDHYKSVMKDLQKQGIDFKVDGRKVYGETTIKGNDQTIFTTIPYDKGWSAYVDGKKVDIKAFKNGFVTFNVPKGHHKIELSFFPQGLKLGIILFIICTTAFIFYDAYFENKENNKLNQWMRKKHHKK